MDSLLLQYPDTQSFFPIIPVSEALISDRLSQDYLNIVHILRGIGNHSTLPPNVTEFYVRDTVMFWLCFVR